MCPLPSFNSYKFLAAFVAESTLLPTFPLSIVCFFFFTHLPYKSRDAVKLPGWNFWEFICRCWPRATGRDPQSPWRVRPPRRWGALCRCSECPWCRWPHKRRSWPGRTCPWPTTSRSDGRRQPGSLGWLVYTCSWPWALFCQALGNPPLSPEEHVIYSVLKQV